MCIQLYVYSNIVYTDTVVLIQVPSLPCARMHSMVMGLVSSVCVCICMSRVHNELLCMYMYICI